MDSGANLDVRDHVGTTALGIALERRNSEVVEALRAAGDHKTAQ